VELAGWGVTRIAERTQQSRAQNNDAQVFSRLLQVARLQYWRAENCDHDPRFISRAYRLKPGQICAGSTGNESACLGDSGGPLIRRRPKTVGGGGPVLVGLVSFGIGCGNRNAPSGFVDIRAYDQWIANAQKRYRPGAFTLAP
jgi:secreted trypsin-like serine protease